MENQKPQSIFGSYQKFLSARPDRKLVPLESVLSCPILVFHQKTPSLLYFYYATTKKTESDKIKLYRPHSKVLISSIDAKVYYFINLRYFDNPTDPKWEVFVGEFPHEGIMNLTLKQYIEEKNRLISMYDEILPLIIDNNAKSKLAGEFKTLFLQICEPGLMPFMKQSGRIFFNWLDLIL